MKLEFIVPYMFVEQTLSYQIIVATLKLNDFFRKIIRVERMVDRSEECQQKICVRNHGIEFQKFR